MLIDLHAHSYLSKDCNLDPRQVLERAASHGLDGVAFTETNTQDGCDELFDLQAKTSMRIFVGLELNTDKGQYLCFFAKPHLAPEPVQLWGSNREKPWSADECLPKVKALGAVIVAARPYDKEFSHPALDYVSSVPFLTAVEGYNAKVRQSANDLAIEAALARKLPCVGGSDARGSLDEVGRGATFFKKDINGQEELVKALQEGEYWAVAVGELPKLLRPGEARELEKKASSRKRKRRR